MQKPAAVLGQWEVGGGRCGFSSAPVEKSIKTEIKYIGFNRATTRQRCIFHLIILQ